MADMINCKACNTTISKDAKACPHCGKPQKMSVGKKILVGFGVLVLLGVIGNMGKSNRTAPAPSARAQASSPEPSRPVAPAPTLKLDEEFRVGEFTYRIDGVKTANRIGNEFVNERPSEGAVFLVVAFTEKNEGQKTHTGIGAPIVLRDSRGREFRPSSRAETALMMSGGNHEMIPELQPGIAHQAKTAFEIPAESASGEVRLVVKERGTFGTREATVAVALQ